jgi:hypothetical protein
MIHQQNDNRKSPSNIKAHRLSSDEGKREEWKKGTVLVILVIKSAGDFSMRRVYYYSR